MAARRHGGQPVVMRSRRLAAVSGLALAVAAGAAWAAARGGPRIAGCPVFPADNAWNRRVDRLPVAKDSTLIVRSIGASASLHADFGSGLWDGGPIGIPVTIVGPATPSTRVAFDYADESDPGPYP